MRTNRWSKLVHHCEMLRDLLFDFGAQPVLTQVPHFIEQRSNDSEPIYNAVLDYLDFDDDLNELSQQIEQLKNRYQSDWEAARDKYGFRLEMIIILFFAIDTYDFWAYFALKLYQSIIDSASRDDDNTEHTEDYYNYNNIFDLDSSSTNNKENLSVVS